MIEPSRKNFKYEQEIRINYLYVGLPINSPYFPFHMYKPWEKNSFLEKSTIAPATYLG